MTLIRDALCACADALIECESPVEQSASLREPLPVPFLTIKSSCCLRDLSGRHSRLCSGVMFHTRAKKNLQKISAGTVAQ